MQEEIINIIEKNKKELNSWVAQFEIVELIKKSLKDFSPNIFNDICRALEKIRKYEELEYYPLICKNNVRKNYIFVLKKVKREDLIKYKKKFRRGSFIYKLK